MKLFKLNKRVLVATILGNKDQQDVGMPQLIEGIYKL